MCQFFIEYIIGNVITKNMLNPFKKGHQYNVAKNSFVIRINLLDGTSTEFNLQPNVTGNDCLDKVAQTLEMDLQEVYD